MELLGESSKKETQHCTEDAFCFEDDSGVSCRAVVQLHREKRVGSSNDLPAEQDAAARQVDFKVVKQSCMCIGTHCEILWSSVHALCVGRSDLRKTALALDHLAYRFAGCTQEAASGGRQANGGPALCIIRRTMFISRQPVTC